MKYCIVYFTLFFTFIIYADQSDDSAFILKKSDNNFFFQITNRVSGSVNDQWNLMYNRPNDRFYPINDSMVQSYYTFPVNKNFGIGPSFFAQNVMSLSHNINDIAQSTEIGFDSVIYGGLSFVFTPFISKINKPAFYLFMDFGPVVMLHNNYEMSKSFVAMPGGYSSQVLILPLMPIHLFIMDMNLIALLKFETPVGTMPAVRIRNHFLLRFAFSNFVDKKIGLGVKVKNIYSFILTGKPSIEDLKSQYAYDKVWFSLYWNGLKGFEIESGYGFEYYTAAREPDFHTAHKFFTELSFSKNGFLISGKYNIQFWDSSLANFQPVSQFEVSVGYRIERF